MSADLPDILIAEIPKNKRETIRVQLRSFKGSRNVDARVFVNGEDAPIATGKGLSIRPDLLPAIIEGLAKAQEAAREEATIGEAGD
jgi:Transcriptional Coactivator p15 (PC4)